MIKKSVVYLLSLFNQDLISLLNQEVVSYYPTPRWLKVCRSSNISRWHINRTDTLKEFLNTNGFDILYM